MSDEKMDQHPELPDSSGMLGMVETLITAVREARSVPLSDHAMVDREQFLLTLEQMKVDLPEELRAARWMVREREAFIGRTNEKAKAILGDAQARSKEMVSESHVLAEAVEEANILIRQAEGEARRVRLEAEDLAEDKLQHLETLFANLLKQIRQARMEFHQARPASPEPPL